MSLGFIEKEEKKIRKIKFRRKGCGGEKKRRNYQFGILLFSMHWYHVKVCVAICEPGRVGMEVAMLTCCWDRQSPGHACWWVKQIYGSCEIVNGKVWRTQLSWMSKIDLENHRKNEGWRIDCGRYVWSSGEKSSNIEFCRGDWRFLSDIGDTQK